MSKTVIDKFSLGVAVFGTALLLLIAGLLLSFALGGQ